MHKKVRINIRLLQYLTVTYCNGLKSRTSESAFFKVFKWLIIQCIVNTFQGNTDRTLLVYECYIFEFILRFTYNRIGEAAVITAINGTTVQVVAGSWSVTPGSVNDHSGHCPAGSISGVDVNWPWVDIRGYPHGCNHLFSLFPVLRVAKTDFMLHFSHNRVYAIFVLN